jgi:hypothetical protein
MADDGRRGRRDGSRDGGVSSPIYRLEGSWTRLMAPGGGRSGPGMLDGEVAEGAAADCVAGRCGGSGRRRGSVPARGRAKGQARGPWRAPLGPLGRGRAMDEVHRRRMGERRRSREGRGKQGVVCKFQKFEDLPIN